MKYLSIIGAGKMSKEYLRVLQDLDECEVVGIYSRTYKKSLELSKEFNINYVANSVSDLFQNTNSNLVIICVNEASTLLIAKEVFTFDWAALFEKPFGMNPAETKLIASYAREAINQNIFIALNRRYYEATAAAKMQLNDLSGPRVININDQEDTVAAQSSGRSELEIKNWHYLNAIHIIDYALIFGRGSITDLTQKRFDLGDNAFMQNAVIQFSSGDVAIYQCLWNRPAPWFVSISTTTKRVVLQPLENCYITTINKRTPIQAVTLNKDKYFKPGLYNMVRAFINYKKNSSKLVNIKEYKHLITLINNIYPD